MLMLYRSLLVALALAASVNAQDPVLSSLSSKWRTVSGFSAFRSKLQDRLITFAVTQRFITDPAALATFNPTVLAKETGIVSFGSVAGDIVSQFAATATDLSPSARREFISDYAAIGSSVGNEIGSALATGSEGPSNSAKASASSTKASAGTSKPSAGKSSSGESSSGPSATNTASSTTETTTTASTATSARTSASSAAARNAAGLARMDLLSMSCAMAALIVAIAVAL